MFLRHIAVKIAEFQQFFPVIFPVVHRNPSNGFVEGFLPVGVKPRQEHYSLTGATMDSHACFFLPSLNRSFWTYHFPVLQTLRWYQPHIPFRADLPRS